MQLCVEERDQPGRTPLGSFTQRPGRMGWHRQEQRRRRRTFGKRLDAGGEHHLQVLTIQLVPPGAPPARAEVFFAASRQGFSHQWIRWRSEPVRGNGLTSGCRRLCFARSQPKPVLLPQYWCGGPKLPGSSRERGAGFLATETQATIKAQPVS